ncbi:MAG: hypothetical protein GX605_02095 [Chloroflexi bacterium]|nr:hypothetical protein [Chloroflexota bacterium]
MDGFLPGAAYPAWGLLAMLAAATAAHEGGHMLAARWLGIPVRRVAVGLGPVLWRRERQSAPEFVLRALPLGVTVGVPARLDEHRQARRPLWHDLLLALSGPLASLLLTLALLPAAVLLREYPGATACLQATALLSLYLGLANLIPCPGLDGGHVLVLCAAGVGLQLRREQEAALHRWGLRLAAGACLAASAAAVIKRL